MLMWITPDQCMVLPASLSPPTYRALYSKPCKSTSKSFNKICTQWLTWNSDRTTSLSWPASHATSISPVPPVYTECTFCPSHRSMSASWKEHTRLRALVPVLHLANTTVGSEEPAKLSNTDSPQITAFWGSEPPPQSILSSYNASKLQGPIEQVEMSQARNTLNPRTSLGLPSVIK